jgi:hypothetical protein
MKATCGLFLCLVLTGLVHATELTARERAEQARRQALYLEEQNNRILEAQAEILRRLEAQEEARAEAARVIAQEKADAIESAARVAQIRAEIRASRPSPAPTPRAAPAPIPEPVAPSGEPLKDWQAAEAASVLVVKTKYPFLADKAHPKRKQLDDYIAKMHADPKNAYLFRFAFWPELMVIDCARLYKW